MNIKTVGLLTAFALAASGAHAYNDKSKSGYKPSKPKVSCQVSSKEYYRDYSHKKSNSKYYGSKSKKTTYKDYGYKGKKSCDRYWG